MRYKVERHRGCPSIHVVRADWGMALRSPRKPYSMSGTYKETSSTGAESPIPECRLSESAIALVRVEKGTELDIRWIRRHLGIPWALNPTRR